MLRYLKSIDSGIYFIKFFVKYNLLINFYFLIIFPSSLVYFLTRRVYENFLIFSFRILIEFILRRFYIQLMTKKLNIK